jgi:hypothetical protein
VTEGLLIPITGKIEIFSKNFGEHFTGIGFVASCEKNISKKKVFYEIL